mmetsp:Transcript_96444/g.201488  ORF Transcript_96444/g.201488 Transcript_96444/m.201488 type:complete len:789 (+) Transcript_96444:167-2533(+)|eukprot:CAMPEP_0206473990 /NCGR_PEP_ID=MMETSP0324_2-20121206/33210_1 /ASSEMBLY_ACC=CAM_ASM_000836 /TAXON_ID=2866 /ORGANISM="Crypthecodinium cohnii, Strain Seligo" /LENGTH=788 /DNA_ID=CAMNT_0053949057 /DNA_START=71 /DNA_END=2437 /DNA_ORIENTATION=+
MGGASSYLAILSICGFLSAAWLATKLSQMAGVSSIVLEITTGVILGPSVLGLISEEYASCEFKRYTDCDPPRNLLELAANHESLGEELDHISHESCSYWADLYADHTGGSGGHGTDDHTTITTTSTLEDIGETGNETDSHTTVTTTNGHGVTTTTIVDPHATTTVGGHATTTTRVGTTTTRAATTTTPHPTTTTLAVTTTTKIVAGATTTVHAGATTTTKVGATTTRVPTTTTRFTGWDDEIDSVIPTGGNDDTDGSVRRLQQPRRVQMLQKTQPKAFPLVRRLSSSTDGSEFSSYDQCLYKSCQSEVSHECGLYPDVFTLIGHTGVALMIFESGMHFDFEKAKVVGPKACVVAVVGTILPLVTGTLLMMLYGYPMSPDGLSVGTALAPTSVGIALRLLGEAGVLQQEFGQAIITAAFVDDILSLVLFNVLFSLRGDFDVMATVVNPIIGIVFMGIAMSLAVKFWPWAINEKILPRLPRGRTSDPKISIEDEGLFFIMMTLLVAYASITHFLGTHLWGCFIAGMSFACVDKAGQKGHTHHVWVRQTKRFTSWMIRIFFACTVAFSIPVGSLMSFNAFWKGSLLGIGPCIMTKVLCAGFMGSARFVIGWAMVGRAEFAYLIAQMAAASNMIDEEAFSIAIWALLYATVFAPFIFRAVLNRYIAANGIERGPSVNMDELSDEEDDDEAIEEKTQEEGFHVSHAAPSAPTATKEVHQPAMTVENTKFGKEFEDLDKIKIEDGTQDRDFSVGAGDGAAGTRRLWFGRQQTPGVTDAPGGFLCCLFFKKAVIS